MPGYIRDQNVSLSIFKQNYYIFVLLLAPNPQAKPAYYRTSSQPQLFNNFDVKKEQFLSRGHLVPNGGFGPLEDRAFTFIMTNVAPQWQLFNLRNWGQLDAAVRQCIWCYRMHEFK